MKALDPLGAARAAVSANPGRPAMTILHDTPGARLVVFRIAAGQSVPPHRNLSTVQLLVLSGSGVLTGEGDGAAAERACEAGDLVVYEPNELHGMRAPDSELLLLATITPSPGSR